MVSLMIWTVILTTSLSSMILFGTPNLHGRIPLPLVELFCFYCNCTFLQALGFFFFFFCGNLIEMLCSTMGFVLNSKILL